MILTPSLSAQEWAAIKTALRVAALQYAIDAHANADHPRVKAAFLQQAQDANNLGDKLDRVL